MRIAAILTCHNRKNKTIACLNSLFSICPDIQVYLTDDGCTDGTPEAVRELYPLSVHIVNGNGNLYWSRGMYTAWKEAIKGNYDYYLWLNDDIELYPFFLKELFECNSIGGGNCIISGLIENFEHNRILYGGTGFDGKLNQTSEIPQLVSHMNGNVVLVPASVVAKIGIIDPVLHHDLGDVDYGLTAIENNIKVYTTRIPIASGYPNGICRVRKWNSSLLKRFQKLNHPLGSPLKTNFYFRKKHFGIIKAGLFCLHVIVINILPDSMVVKIWGDTYINKD